MDVVATTIRLPKPVHADVERIAAEEDRSIASALRRLIAAGIAARKPQGQQQRKAVA